MEFTRTISSIMLSTLASCTFALNNQEMVNLINQHGKQYRHQPINLTQQTNALNWSSLHGPRMGSSVHIIQLQNNPSVLFAFRKYASGVIYKSIDSGQHWQSLPTPIDKQLNDLVSLDENRLLLAAGNKIYSSTDQGEHWIENDFGKAAYEFFVLNPNLILLEVNRNFSSCDLYRSLDGGKTWAPANLGLERGYDFWGMGGKDNLLFVGTDTLNISTNGGESWTHADKWKDHFIDSIAVNSKHDIFLGGISVGLIKTDPQGKTWVNIRNGIDGKIHHVIVDKQDHVYVRANGLYRSTDNGQSWQLLIDLPNLTDFKVLDNGKILLSTNDSLMLSDDSQLHYEKLPTSFSMSETDHVLALDEKHFFAIDGWMQGPLYSSQDAGKTWVLNRAGISNAITSFNNQVVALEFDEPYQNIMVSKDKGVTWQKTYRFYSSEACESLSSQNGGLILSCYTGQYFSRDLSSWKQMTSSGQSSGYFDGQSIYSCDGVSIKVTKDEGKTWTTLLGNLVPYTTYMTGYRDKVILTAIYATGIIKMTKDGAWEIINNGLTHFAFSNIIALSEDNYVVAMDTGIFYTNDGGKHWTPENDGLENLDVKSLSANENILLAGTKGSGVFKALLK